MLSSWMELLQFRKFGKISPALQIGLIVALFLLITWIGYLDFQRTGLIFGYPLRTSILFVPIYEELIFRGFIFGSFLEKQKLSKSMLFTSLLFGFWHFKNIFFLSSGQLLWQMLYAALIFSPIACLLTAKTRSIWPAVIFHFLNNLAAFFLNLELLQQIFNFLH